MKKDNIIYRIIIVYYALTCIFFFHRIQSFAKDILIAPLYFLVPAGIGLLIFSFVGIKKLLNYITRMHLILTASFLGFVLIPLLYLQLNLSDFLEGVFLLLYPLLMFLSLHGFYNAREILQADEEFKCLLKYILMLIPLFFVFYYFHFMHFASFPLRDIFMEVHFMKGAMELSKYQIINIATGDTYIPLLQVFYGLLNYFYSYDLINSQWILPFYSFLFHISCIYCFYSSFIKDRFMLAVSLIFTVIFIQFFPNTNGQFLFSLSLVLFSMLIFKNKDEAKLLPVASELIGLIIIAGIIYFNRRFPVGEATFFPILAGYLCFIFMVSFFNLNRFLPLTIVALMLFLAVPLHRGVIMIVPLIFCLYVMYFICFQWRVTDRVGLKYSLLKRMIRYSIICPSAGLLLGFLIYKKWPFSEAFINSLLWKIYLLFGGEVAYSHEGIVGILAEWVRIVPPAFHFMILLLAAGIFIEVKRNYTESRRVLVETNINYIVFCFFSLVILLFMYFMPFPHIQRIVLYPALMLCALTGFLFKFYFDKESNNSKKFIIPIAIVVYTVAFKYIYDRPWKYAYATPSYIAELSPIPEIGLAVMVLSLAALILWRKSSFALIFISVILMSGVTVDRFKIISKLYESPYGPVFPEPKVISHYSLAEIETAKALNATILTQYASLKYVMMSDPYTLGIFEAITGNNGFYTFSNLGQFMLPQYTKDLKAVVRKAFPLLDDKVASQGRDKADLLDNNTLIISMIGDFAERYKGAMPEARYGLHKKFGVPRNHAANGDSLGWNADDFRRNILWIVSEKTVRWAYGDVGYYPMNDTFSDEYLKSYVFPYFEVLHNSLNKVLVLRLK